jgi:hypothetical protein
MVIVPLNAVPNQNVNVTLDGQATTLHVYQTLYGVFIDVFVNNVLVIGGVICQNLNRIVRDTYLGFLGDLMFLDNEGSSDPQYTGLGARWSLIYLFPSDLPAGAG